MIKITNQQIDEKWDNAPDDIKEAVFSPFYNDLFDKITASFHISEEKQDVLRRLCFLTFLGFVDFQDLYKEIRDSLAIDPRIALEIYHELDKKIFDSFKKDIEDEFLRYRMGIRKESEISASRQVPPQVVLREGPEVINLKPETPVELQPLKLKIETTPFAEKPKEAAPVSLGGIAVSPGTPKFQPSKPESGPPTVGQAPFMLHQKEEAKSVAQTQAAGAYKQKSFGGFFGSLKTARMQRLQQPVSTARVEMPFGPKFSSEEEAQKVPVVVKKYEGEPIKTIHYSDLKTSLEKTEDGKIKPIIPPQTPPIQPKKPDIGGGMVDLTNLTIKK